MESDQSSVKINRVIHTIFLTMLGFLILGLTLDIFISPRSKEIGMVTKKVVYPWMIRAKWPFGFRLHVNGEREFKVHVRKASFGKVNVGDKIEVWFSQLFGVPNRVYLDDKILDWGQVYQYDLIALLLWMYLFVSTKKIRHYSKYRNQYNLVFVAIFGFFLWFHGF